MKERLIGACILVALAVIFIPMFVEEPAPAGMVTKDVDLPASATAVSAFQMSLTRNTPPEPISPRVAAGEAPAEARSGRIDRTAAPATRAVEVALNAAPEPTTARTVPVDLPAPDKSQPVAANKPAAADDAPVDPAASLSGWFVQAGSFANRDNAERLTKRLQGKDFNAFMLRARSGDQTVYRVRIGPLEARREAERLAPTVAAASGGPTEVVSNP
ncbi:MAG TPA: SPOR domain-containing protein [Gammaproteobacteria bacterium]|nr:SPOR domain-containing protein [Gammaproteobacteria bacterium]